MNDYTHMTDDQASAARMADRGAAWQMCDGIDDDWPAFYRIFSETMRQALHDRDRFQRERDWWREECIRPTGEALA